jgi:hypothetical protein
VRQAFKRNVSVCEAYSATTLLNWSFCSFWLSGVFFLGITLHQSFDRQVVCRDALQQGVGTVYLIIPLCDTIDVTAIKLCKIALQVFLAATLLDTAHTALEHIKNAAAPRIAIFDYAQH